MPVLRCLARLLLFAPLIVTTRSVAQQQFEPIRQEIRAGMLRRNVPSLAVAVAKDGKIVWEEGFGWADREHRIAADENTMYSLASISKPLTATGLMTLVAAGKVDLDKPINDYLGKAKLRAHIGSADEATVRRIANHSAGLPEHFQFFYENEPWRPESPDETILRYGELYSKPGERFQYSNLDYGTLDYIISRVSERSFADYMRNEVFLKLGMTRTSIGVDPALRDFAATRYDGEDLTPISPYEFDHNGASAVYSSAHDLVRFGMFSLKEHLPDQAPILTDEAIDQMQQPTIVERPGIGYGIGWEIDQTSKYRIVTHSGGMPGVATWLRLVPSERLAIVVLCNENDHLAHEVADAITKLMLPGWAQENPGPRSPPVPPSKTMIGVWRGAVETYRESIPLQFTLLPSGEVKAKLGNQLETLVNGARFENDTLSGLMNGDIHLPDASRRPYILSLSLRIHDGDVLSGAVTARADGEGTMPAYQLVAPVPGMAPPLRVEKDTFVISQWTELRKVK
jgi:CubicO group peptidase (beta-lactamase class C family)